MELAEVERALRRPAEYYFEDGLWEIAVGLWLALTVVAPLFAGGALANWSPVLALLASLVVNPLVVAAKERWVYPRTGRVSYPSPESAAEPHVALGLGPGEPAAPGARSEAPRMLRLATSALISASIALSFAIGRRGAAAGHLGPAAWMGHVAVGLLLGAGMTYGAWRFGQRRWLVLGLALAASGFLIVSFAGNREQALAWQVSVFAAALVASGLVAFVSCMRRTGRAGEPDGR